MPRRWNKAPDSPADTVARRVSLVSTEEGRRGLGTVRGQAHAGLTWGRSFCSVGFRRFEHGLSVLLRRGDARSLGVCGTHPKARTTRDEVGETDGAERVNRLSIIRVKAPHLI